MQRLLTTFEVKNFASKCLSLERLMIMYNKGSDEDKKNVLYKFKQVWGLLLASDFVVNYQDAKDLIHSLDEGNLQLFIEKF